MKPPTNKVNIFHFVIPMGLISTGSDDSIIAFSINENAISSEFIQHDRDYAFIFSKEFP